MRRGKGGGWGKVTTPTLLGGGGENAHSMCVCDLVHRNENIGVPQLMFLKYMLVMVCNETVKIMLINGT